jgi:hypothetical protein
MSTVPPPDHRTGSTTAVDEADELEGGLFAPDADLEDIIAIPLWRIRLRLWWGRMVENWRLFAENKIGVLGLAIIILFALMALSHPILMNYVWEARTHDPVIGYSAPRVEMEVV